LPGVVVEEEVTTVDGTEGSVVTAGFEVDEVEGARVGACAVVVGT
jgi:hypothetical protein